MSRWIRRLGIALGSLVVLVVAFAGFVYAASNSKVDKVYDVPVKPLTVNSDSATIERGKHFATSIGKCVDCHGEDFGGLTFINDPAFGVVAGSNLTTGTGGVLATYSNDELERAIRHGIKRDGRGALIMPSEQYQAFTDEDLGAVIAYLRSLPPVNRTTDKVALGAVGRALLATGQLPLFAVDIINHKATHPASMMADTTLEYGRYIGTVGGCNGCHGRELSGGPIPGMPPEATPAANLTPTGIGQYNDAQLEAILRTGVRPDGSKLGVWMPWKYTAMMTPVEMTATIKYLRSAAPKEYGGR